MYYENFVYGANFIIFAYLITTSMSRPKKDSEKVLKGVVLVRLSASELAGINAIAEEYNYNKSQVVRGAIDHFLNSVPLKTKRNVNTKRLNS